ncbi:hypothetical protein BDW75DRAFT_99386 [Aspergillus navahoensis]
MRKKKCWCKCSATAVQLAKIKVPRGHRQKPDACAQPRQTKSQERPTREIKASKKAKPHQEGEKRHN